MEEKVIGNDLVVTYQELEQGQKKKVVGVLSWGDEVTVIAEDEEFYHIHFDYYVEKHDGSFELDPRTALISSLTKLVDPKDDGILKIDFVDVQQGDAIYLETPKKKRILFDGGDNQLFSRYLASTFPNTSKENPQIIDAIVVSHGDADHFEGLIEIKNSETNRIPEKRLFLYPKRIYHNGIVKSSKTENGKKVPPKKRLGKTTESDDGALYLIDLFKDVTRLSKSRLNATFEDWVNAINHWRQHGSIKLDRLEYDESKIPFDFVSEEKLEISVLGPRTEKVNGKNALPFLKSREKPLPRVILGEPQDDDFSGHSISHTINGHSIILKIKYGNVRFLLTGDLNKESGRELFQFAKTNGIDLKSEIFKAPHHGSHDFSSELLKSVSPVVSIISSGDENSFKEHIHPRAFFVGALGKFSRIDEPLIFVTELAAFFKNMGWVSDEIFTTSEMKTKASTSQEGPFYAFKRTAFGTVHVRTNGTRVLVYTHSGKEDKKESYVFTVSKTGKIKFELENLIK